MQYGWFRHNSQKIEWRFSWKNVSIVNWAAMISHGWTPFCHDSPYTILVWLMPDDIPPQVCYMYVNISRYL